MQNSDYNMLLSEKSAAYLKLHTQSKESALKLNDLIHLKEKKVNSILTIVLSMILFFSFFILKVENEAAMINAQSLYSEQVLNGVPSTQGYPEFRDMIFPLAEKGFFEHIELIGRDIYNKSNNAISIVLLVTAIFLIASVHFPYSIRKNSLPYYSVYPLGKFNSNNSTVFRKYTVAKVQMIQSISNVTWYFSMLMCIFGFAFMSRFLGDHLNYNSIGVENYCNIVMFILSAGFLTTLYSVAKSKQNTIRLSEVSARLKRQRETSLSLNEKFNTALSEMIDSKSDVLELNKHLKGCENPMEAEAIRLLICKIEDKIIDELNTEDETLANEKLIERAYS